MKRLFLIFFTICTNIFLFAAEEMPIIAYMGVPYDKTTDQNFKNFRDCGFNVSLYIYANLEQMVGACNMAHKYGVKILGHCQETHNAPEKAAAVLKDNPGFFGYVLQDEPSAAEIKERQKEITRLRKVDDKHCFYINLHPYYDEWTLRYTKTKTYEEYLDAAASTSCRQMSFDYYPITKDGLREGWYNNLEMIRKKSLEKRIPFWGFVLSVPHGAYPTPTMGALRLQVYSNLAYGAQAIQYFTYWTPLPEKVNNYHDGPVDHNGNKTKTYRLVQQMNQELKSISPLFLGAKVFSVGHLGVIPEGTKKQTTMPENLKSLKIIGNKGAVISQFEKDSHTYLAIVNKNYEKTAQVIIEADNKTLRHITKKLQEEEIKKYYTLQAGDILIFKLK
ncbi:MAG: beta-galactosidase [Prevotella sp.]|nr:beta-galactosidase [Prevotella sp.]